MPDPNSTATDPTLPQGGRVAKPGEGGARQGALQAPPSPPTPLPTGEGSHTRSSLPWLWLSALTLILDQLTKLAVMAKLAPYRDAIPLTGFFSLVHVHNTGAAFSLFADQPGWQKGFFMAVAIIAAVVILHLLRKTRGRPMFAAALALVLGGAVGNLIDRVLYGHVIDFLLVYVGDWSWPAFNVADSAITLGAGLLILDALRHPGGHPVQGRGGKP